MSISKDEKFIQQQDTKLLESKLKIGERLVAIKQRGESTDDEGYREHKDADGNVMYGSMNQYLEDRCGGKPWDFTVMAAQHYMSAWKTYEHLRINGVDVTGLSVTVLRDLATLAPNEPKAASGVGTTERDIDNLNVEEVKEVIEEAVAADKKDAEIKEAAEKPDTARKPSVRNVRDAVQARRPSSKKQPGKTFKKELLNGMKAVKKFIRLIDNAQPKQLQTKVTKNVMDELNPDWQMIVQLVEQYHDVKEMSE